MIYLDNAATTIMPPTVQKEMIKWCNKGNPSASYTSAKAARQMMNDFRKYIGGLCAVNPCCEKGLTDAPAPSNYKIIFTSGATEANCTVLASLVSAWAETAGAPPNVVMSSIEHHSLMDMAKSYQERGLATITFVPPTSTGHIPPERVEEAIAPNTCLVCVMHANNETGAINDIASIGAAAHRHNVPFHCDTVQMFGKHPLDPVRCGVDSFCISFHKLQGPPGVGALVIKQELISGWRVHPYIFGSQNAGLRGGTENLPGIGAAFAATKLTFIGRKEKNEQLLALKRYIVNELNMRMPARSYTQYLASSRGRVSTPEVELVFLCGANPAEYLPNTILLSVVKHTEPFICNSKLKQALEASGVVVSIGSACNTDSPKASHVLYAMGCDDLIRKGTLRITLGDQTTAAEAKQFVQTFLLTVKEAIGQ